MRLGVILLTVGILSAGLVGTGYASYRGVGLSPTTAAVTSTARRGPSFIFFGGPSVRTGSPGSSFSFGGGSSGGK
ncbi:MAG: hypothetical protein ACOYL5_20410 [Phototrophicaceae bacterium]|jgi:hypothetical protein